MPRYALDIASCYAALDDARRTRGLSWSTVAQQTGLAAPAFSRLKNGRTISVDYYLTIAVWLGHRVPYALECPTGVPATPQNS